MGARGSVIKRGSAYSVVLDLGRGPDGRRRREWHSGFPTQRAAEKERTRLLKSLDDGTHVRRVDTTVKEFVTTTWLPGLAASSLRPSTVESYHRSAKSYLLPHLGALRLREVTPVCLKSWIDVLKAAGVGDRTVQIAGVTAHKMLKAAVDLELIARNPADNAAVREARPKTKAQVPTLWTSAQTRTFLASQSGDRLFPLWRLVVMTGLRRGEIAGLRWCDVDLSAGVLHVRRTRVVVDYKVLDSSPKTEKGKRSVGLDAATVAALKAHRARQAEELLALGRHRAEDGLVFVREDGEPYHPQRLTIMLSERTRAAGLPRVKLHALRHGHATAALEAGVPMKVVSERLGHSGIAITSDVYSHVTKATDHAAAAQVAAVIDGP
jgi:integrase